MVSIYIDNPSQLPHGDFIVAKTPFGHTVAVPRDAIRDAINEGISGLHKMAADIVKHVVVMHSNLTYDAYCFHDNAWMICNRRMTTHITFEIFRCVLRKYIENTDVDESIKKLILDKNIYAERNLYYDAQIHLIDDERYMSFNSCNGGGRIICTHCYGSASVKCPSCNGSGKEESSSSWW